MRKRGASGPVKGVGEDEKDVKDVKDGDDKGAAEGDDKEEKPKPVRPRVTVWQTFKGGLTSAPTMVLMMAIGMNIFGRREDPDQSWASFAAPIILLVSMAVGSVLVTKMENSEWRQSLRAEVAASEKKEMEKKGINQQDLNVAAFNMGIAPTNFGQG
mmetsp:Transcript_9414/g.16131  ORF Transcript_9414/g.16131 Transcript_9414/m.16131 type:complete len:157 (-) Transcript_9414:184-654(-)